VQEGCQSGAVNVVVFALGGQDLVLRWRCGLLEIDRLRICSYIRFVFDVLFANALSRNIDGLR
jgi:hypothetical protein